MSARSVFCRPFQYPSYPPRSLHCPGCRDRIASMASKSWMSRGAVAHSCRSSVQSKSRDAVVQLTIVTDFAVWLGVARVVVAVLTCCSLRQNQCARPQLRLGADVSRQATHRHSAGQSSCTISTSSNGKQLHVSTRHWNKVLRILIEPRGKCIICKLMFFLLHVQARQYR
jgi:hypothetical protein